jgi:hypothetical protein
MLQYKLIDNTIIFDTADLYCWAIATYWLYKLGDINIKIDENFAWELFKEQRNMEKW